MRTLLLLSASGIAGIATSGYDWFHLTGGGGEYYIAADWRR
jgi:hypothetical protein